MRLGYVLALVVFCRLLQQAGFVGEGWLQVVSRESLMVYVAHLFLIYRLPFRGETVYDFFRQSMSVNQCIALTLGMILLMILLAKVWSWMKANHLKTFRLEPLSSLHFDCHRLLPPLNFSGLHTCKDKPRGALGMTGGLAANERK